MQSRRENDRFYPSPVKILKYDSKTGKFRSEVRAPVKITASPPLYDPEPMVSLAKMILMASRFWKARI
jgi:hypothetical protein